MMSSVLDYHVIPYLAHDEYANSPMEKIISCMLKIVGWVFFHIFFII